MTQNPIDGSPAAALAHAFRPFAEKMQREQLPDVAIRAFQRAYGLLRSGAKLLVSESDIRPVESVPSLADLSKYHDRGLEALASTALVKLNGGLGTSMGLDGPKSLIEVRPGLTFLDIVARQVEALARNRGTRVPLVLMNSFRTEAESLARLSAYPGLSGSIRPSFLQHKVPKVDAHELRPASRPTDPELEWCPPGHGDLYAAIVTSGVLEELLHAGIRWVFVSNVDNLGAALDPCILGYLASESIPFLMEVTDRTAADRKGGHLAELPTGRLTLREIAQTPADELEAFQDIQRHRYFNTNNLWIDLVALKGLLAAHDQIVPLPVIRNEKTVDPADPRSDLVIQLETAMGAAIELFDGARAVRVPRTRFAAVKTCSDLVVVGSDAYLVDDDYHLVPNPARSAPSPLVELDGRFYKLYREFRARFPEGMPSLVACDRLSVRGDIRFGGGVTLEDSVSVINDGDGQASVPSGARLRGEVRLSG
jgi:UTP--glucose-1-phosphate uridylyltransferase